jgi:predicted RNase H-like HicB family nuclease
MANWRDELTEVIKSKAERDAEEAERQKKRLEEALEVADDALRLALEGLKYTHEQIDEKSQPSKLEESEGAHTLSLHELSLVVGLSRSDAVLKVTFNDGRPRDFDFAKDRHLSPKDVEEYVGRRAVEFARAAQKQSPW